MAGRLFLATAVVFAVGCVALGLYDTITGIYEYNSKQEPKKRPYEHSNHSDETLVDSTHEATKHHEDTPLAPGSGSNNLPRFHQTLTPPPTPPRVCRWPVGGAPPKGRVIIFEDSMPSDEETYTPLSVLPLDVLGTSFSKFEVQETIEQVLGHHAKVLAPYMQAAPPNVGIRPGRHPIRSLTL